MSARGPQEERDARHVATGEGASKACDPEATVPLRTRLARILPYVGLVLGLLIIAAPTISDRLDAWRANNTISTLSSTVEALPAEEKARLLDQAQRYNAQLAGGTAEDERGAGEIMPYEQQLRSDNATMMAWLEIPSIELRLPIYHGTGEAELSAGVGHLEDSSLPVGGESTHCALTAHSGMAGSRMFDDIRLLEPGDVFVLWTLGDPYAYEVTSSEVVLPDEVDSLRIEQGADLCTLITCTPYGVNSHRLLVHAQRCAYEPETIAEAPARVSSRDLPLIIAAVVLALGALLILLIHLIRRRS